MVKIVIPSETVLMKMLAWRDKNKDSVRDISFNGIESGIINFKDVYNQHFKVTDGEVFMNVVAVGANIRFTYNPKTWRASQIDVLTSDDFDHNPTDAMQDMITVYATAMALIKENHGISKQENGDYVVVM